MSFLKRNKIAVVLVAVLAVVGSAAHFSGMTCCDGPCPLGSIFSATTAYAGAGCSKSGVCDADSKVKATTASATEGKTCNKEDCIKAIMAEKKITHAEAEVVFANAMASGSCHGSATGASMTTASASGCTGSATSTTASASGCTGSATTASASGCSGAKMASGSTGCTASASTASASGTCCASKGSATTASASGCTGGASMTASLVNATEGKTCADKEACITKCMADKGFSRAQAEECYAKCAAAQAIQANVITGSAFTRDSWIDAKVASGMTRPDAEVAAAKAEASGEVKFVSATGCSASKAAGTGGSCCAAKAAATTATVDETKPAATTTSASTGGSN